MQDKATRSASYKKIRRRNFTLAVLAVVFLAIVCLFTPLFDISSISVKGNKIISDKAVIEASDINRGDNLFRINTKRAKKDIMALGYIEDVEIQRKFFSRIEIRVTECEEAAYIPLSGNYVGISSEGKVLSITKKSKLSPKKALVSGCKLKSAQKGQIIEAKNSKNAQTLFELLKILSDNGLMDSVKKIDVTKVKEVSFTLMSDTKIYMGDMTEADYKVKCLDAVLAELGDVRGGRIDLSEPSNIIYEGGN